MPPPSLREPRFLWAGGVVLLAVAVAVAASLAWWRGSRHAPSAGEVLFRQRCATCHSTGDGAGQGPGLGGIAGRTAGTGRGFGYTRALRDSGIVWNGPMLDRFLSGPQALVPGTTMPIAVPDAAERRALVAYLSTLPAGAAGPAVAADAGGPGAIGPFGDYRSDVPGARHHITVADLPPPFASPSSRNGPSIVDRPPGMTPVVPADFEVTVFASGLENPRLVRVAPDGDIFVAETAAHRVRVLRAADGVRAAERMETFAEGLDRPFGMAFYPPGGDPRWLYVANANSVVRFEYRSGDLRARSSPETIIARLTATDAGHSTRDVVFSQDGSRMFLSIGSASNVAEGEDPSPPGGVAAWDAAHGLGATWGDETNRADVLVFAPDGTHGARWATGIRNCVGMAIEPTTGALVCATNERDGLGDNLVPDYVTRVRVGQFYGWPWTYLGDHEDPRHAGERRDLAGRVTVPDTLLQPHTAPLGITFYEGPTFPLEYRGDLFVACHGSWNRAVRTGPKVIRVLFHEGVPTGEYEDFMTGFVADEGHVWGRPVGVAVARDGALLVTEDANGTVFRVTPRPDPRAL